MLKIQNNTKSKLHFCWINVFAKEPFERAVRKNDWSVEVTFNLGLLRIAGFCIILILSINV